MKVNVNKVLVLVSILSFSWLVQASSQQKKILAKCHVELIGGGETIYRRTIKPNSMEQVIAELPNTLINSVYQNQVSVYSVIECVEVDKEFIRASSKIIDERSPK